MYYPLLEIGQFSKVGLTISPYMTFKILTPALQHIYYSLDTQTVNFQFSYILFVLNYIVIHGHALHVECEFITLLSKLNLVKFLLGIKIINILNYFISG